MNFHQTPMAQHFVQELKHLNDQLKATPRDSEERHKINQQMDRLEVAYARQSLMWSRNNG